MVLRMSSCFAPVVHATTYDSATRGRSWWQTGEVDRSFRAARSTTGHAGRRDTSPRGSIAARTADRGPSIARTPDSTSRRRGNAGRVVVPPGPWWRPDLRSRDFRECGTRAAAAVGPRSRGWGSTRRTGRCRWGAPDCRLDAWSPWTRCRTLRPEVTWESEVPDPSTSVPAADRPCRGRAAARADRRRRRLASAAAAAWTTCVASRTHATVDRCALRRSCWRSPIVGQCGPGVWRTCWTPVYDSDAASSRPVTELAPAASEPSSSQTEVTSPLSLLVTALISQMPTPANLCRDVYRLRSTLPENLPWKKTLRHFTQFDWLIQTIYTAAQNRSQHGLRNSSLSLCRNLWSKCCMRSVVKSTGWVVIVVYFALVVRSAD